MCGFALVAGAGLVTLGLWLLATGRSHAQALAPNLRAGAQASDLASGLVLSAVGAGMIVLALMGMVGPWRPGETPPFPMRVLDLNTPPSPLDRGAPSTPPPQR